MKAIPNFVSQYLWDVPLKNISISKNSNFIIERVLEYGDIEAFVWINSNYKKENIISVLRESKKISPKSGSFFALYYGINKEELECIRKPFTQKQNRF
jgi:hypothetical protein